MNGLSLILVGGLALYAPQIASRSAGDEIAFWLWWDELDERGKRLVAAMSFSGLFMVMGGVALATVEIMQ